MKTKITKEEKNNKKGQRTENIVLYRKNVGILY